MTAVDPGWSRAARVILYGLPITCVATLACVLYVDLPLANWLHAHGWDALPGLRWLLTTPILVVPALALYLPVYAVRRRHGPRSRPARIAFVIGSCLLVSQEVKDMLKRAFGRTWPRDVMDPGSAPPSPECLPASLGYVNDGVHSFTAFAGSTKAFQAFPSGSTSALLVVVLPLMVLYPRARIPLALFAFASLAALLVTNTHFLGDIVAGAYVGAVGAAIALALLGERDVA